MADTAKLINDGKDIEITSVRTISREDIERQYQALLMRRDAMLRPLDNQIAELEKLLGMKG